MIKSQNNGAGVSFFGYGFTNSDTGWEKTINNSDNKDKETNFKDKETIFEEWETNFYNQYFDFPSICCNLNNLSVKKTAMDKKAIKKKVLSILQEKKISQTDLMWKLNISRSTAFSFTRNSSMSVERLMELSKAFNYNFLNEFSNMLNISDPPPRLPDGQSYPARMQEMEIEIKTLRKVIAEMTKNS